MREYWASRKSGILRDLVLHATLLSKRQKNQQVSLHQKFVVKSPNRRYGWQIRVQLAHVITSSEAESISGGQKPGTDPNLMAIVSRSSMTPSSSKTLSKPQLSTQASTNRFETCVLCFGKTYKMRDCPLTPEKQTIRLARARKFNMDRTHKRKADQHDAPNQHTSSTLESANNECHNRHP